MITVALADDEVLFTQLLENFFQTQEKVNCLFTAKSGEDMLEQLKEQLMPPDIVILDLKMSGLNGVETAGLIKEKYPTIKSIVMSSFYDKTFMGYMLRVGANAFLPKTISPVDLIKVIEMVHVNDCYFMKEQLEVMRHQIAPQAPKPKLTYQESFTEREREVLRLICQQFTAQEIADQLFVSKRTVDGHKNSLFAKTRARNIAGLVIYAIQHQLIEQTDLPLFN